MASIVRRRGSAIWTCFFRDENGRQHCRSTETADRKTAQRLAQEFEAAAQKKRTLRQLQRVLDQMHELVSGEHVPRRSLRAFALEWLQLKEPETGPRTLAFYKESAEKFLSFLGPRADALLGEITKADLVAYRNTLAKTLAPKTTNHHVKLLRMLFRAAKRDGLLQDDPSEFVETVKRGKTTGSSRRAFTLEEINAVLSVADAEWRSMVLFGLYTGQRLGDLALLTWSNLDLELGQIRFVTSKTNRRMILPMAPALRKQVLSLAAGDNPDAPIHPRAYSVVRRQKRSGSLSNQFSDLLAQAGLRQKKSHDKALNGRSARRQTGELSFHALRHTATSFLHAAGIPAAITQAFIGHDSETTHALYTHVGIENLVKAANALPEVLSQP
jgi:integrase